jgi:hypothetical protein
MEIITLITAISGVFILIIAGLIVKIKSMENYIRGREYDNN